MVALPQSAIAALTAGGAGSDSSDETSDTTSSSVQLPQSAIDALNGTSGSFGDMLKSTETSMNTASPASSFLTAFAQGTLQSGEGMVNLVLRLAGDKTGLNKISGDEKSQDQLFNDINPDNAPSTSIVGEVIPKAKTLGNVAGQSAPYALGGEALSGAKVGEAFGLGSKAGGFWGKLLKRGTTGAAAGAASYDPNNDQGKNAMQGAFLNAVGFPAAATIGKYAFNPVRFSGKLAGMLSKVTPDRISKAIDSINSGRPQLVGGVLKNPALQKFETNTLPTAMFSNYADQVEAVANGLTDQATDLYKTLTDGVKGDANHEVKKLAQGHVKEMNDENRENYKRTDELSGQDQIIYENYFDEAKDLKEDHSSALNAGGLTDEAGLISKLNQIVETGNHTKDLQEISKLSETDPAEAKKKITELKLSGKSTTQPDRSLRTTNFLRSTLGNFKSEALAKGNSQGALVWGQLKDALDLDIGDYLNQPGKEAVKDSYEYSQKFYSENVAPIRTAKIQKHVHGLDDTDTLISSYFVKNQDRPEKMKKLLQAAPNAEAYIMKAALKPAVEKEMVGGKETINPATMDKLLSDKGIGFQRLKILTKGDPKKSQAIQDYKESYETNKDSLKALGNTFNGFQQIPDQNVRNAMQAFAAVVSGGSVGNVKEAVKKHMSTFFMAPASAILKNPQFLRYAYEHKIHHNAQSTANVQGWLLGFVSSMVSQAAQAEGSQ